MSILQTQIGGAGRVIDCNAMKPINSLENEHCPFRCQIMSYFLLR